MKTPPDSPEIILKNDSICYFPIIKEMIKVGTNSPCHGEVAIRLIYRDSKLSRWNVTIEESHLV